MSEAAIAELKVYVRERENQQVPVVSVQLHPQHEPQQLYSMHKQQVKLGMRMVQCCKWNIFGEDNTVVTSHVQVTFMKSRGFPPHRRIRRWNKHLHCGILEMMSEIQLVCHIRRCLEARNEIYNNAANKDERWSYISSDILYAISCESMNASLESVDVINLLI